MPKNTEFYRSISATVIDGKEMLRIGNPALTGITYILNTDNAVNKSQVLYVSREEFELIQQARLTIPVLKAIRHIGRVTRGGSEYIDIPDATGRISPILNCASAFLGCSHDDVGCLDLVAFLSLFEELDFDATYSPDMKIGYSGDEKRKALSLMSIAYKNPLAIPYLKAGVHDADVIEQFIADGIDPTLAVSVLGHD